MSSNLDVGPFGGGNTAVFQDIQANGVAGQGISGSAQVMNLNTVVVPQSWAETISSNQIPLGKGVYFAEIIDTCTTNDSTANNIQYSIRDTDLNHLGGYKINANSDGSTAVFGVNTSGSFYFELTVDKTIEVWIRVAGASIYLRGHNSGGGLEYYQQLRLTKVG